MWNTIYLWTLVSTISIIPWCSFATVQFSVVDYRDRQNLTKFRNVYPSHIVLFKYIFIVLRKYWLYWSLLWSHLHIRNSKSFDVLLFYLIQANIQEYLAFLRSFRIIPLMEVCIRSMFACYNECHCSSGYQNK